MRVNELTEAMVIDNSSFYKDGMITVRLKKEISNYKVMMKDLSENPEEIINKATVNGVSNDVKATIMTSIGGGYDYGCFMLPQPNTWGIVARLADREDKSDDPDCVEFLWLGSIPKFVTTKQGNETHTRIDAPSDKLEEKEAMEDGTVNVDNPYHALVFKQKETHIDGDIKNIGDNSANTLDMKKSPTLNMVVMDKDKIWIVHNNLDDEGENKGQSQIQLDLQGVNITYYNKEEDTNASFNMKNDGTFELSNVSNTQNVANKITATKEHMEFTHSHDGDNAQLIIGPTSATGAETQYIGMSYKSASSAIPTELTINKNGLMINSEGNINITPGPSGHVSLGNSGKYVVFSEGSIPEESPINIDNYTLFTGKAIG